MDVKKRLEQTFAKTNVRENRRSPKQTFEPNRWRLFSEPITGEPKKNGDHNTKTLKERRLF